MDFQADFRAEKEKINYEGIVILHPDCTLEDQKAIFKKAQATVKSFGGEFKKLTTWGKRKLANPIEKIRMGSYFHYYFSADGGVIAELERTFSINESVLRSHHMRLDDRKSLEQHIEEFDQALVASHEREADREAKAQAKKFSREKRSGGGFGGGSAQGYSGKHEGR